jgi:hypothetical protein
MLIKKWHMKIKFSHGIFLYGRHHRWLSMSVKKADSYMQSTFLFWRARRDSNPLPSASETDTLSK